MNLEPNYIIKSLHLKVSESYMAMGRLILASVIMLVLLECEKPYPKRVSLDEEKLNKILDTYVKEGVYPFLYSRIEDEHGVVYEHSVVNEELLGNRTINGDTWMRIWSMSKLVTISIAMNLVEKNKLSLSDPVIKYIPEFKDLKVAVDNVGNSISQSEIMLDECPHILVDMDSTMRVEHLMNHTAGFYYTYTNSQCLNLGLSSLDIPLLKNSKEMIEKLSTVPLVQQPGESYHYGLNIAVLGLVIERITGRNISDTFNEHIGMALELEGLQYTIPEGVDLLPSYTGSNGYLKVASKGDLPILGDHVPRYKSNQVLFLGGVGMLGTARGYIDFLRKVFDPRQSLLDGETIDKMITRPLGMTGEQGFQTGYATYITGDSDYQRDIVTVGGYEFTKCWMDRKNNIIGVLFSQVVSTIDREGLGTKMENEFKKELFKQLKDQ